MWGTLEIRIAVFLVVELGFEMDEVTLMEGESVSLCANLRNITFEEFERFNDEFPVSTNDGTAIGMYCC